MADSQLSDQEIRFLSLWLAEHVDLANTWPGEVIVAGVRSILADGIVRDWQIGALRAAQYLVHEGSYGSYRVTKVRPVRGQTRSVNKLSHGYIAGRWLAEANLTIHAVQPERGRFRLRSGQVLTWPPFAYASCIG